MIRKQFKIHINAPTEKVWKVLWNDDSYRKWTSVFSEGSYAVSDWKEGSNVKFLSPTGEGMYSKIEKLTPNSLMSFKHLGELKNGKEVPPAGTENWTGAMENYKLEERNGTDLIVDMDVTTEFEDYFERKFPEAMQKIKEIAEVEK